MEDKILHRRSLERTSFMSTTLAIAEQGDDSVINLSPAGLPVDINIGSDSVFQSLNVSIGGHKDHEIVTSAAGTDRIHRSVHEADGSGDLEDIGNAKRHITYRLNAFQDRYEYYESLPPFGFFDFVGCLLSILTYTADVGSDIFVAILYFSEEQYIWFGLTVGFIVLPAIVTSSFSIAWYIQDNNYYKKYNIHISTLRWVLRIIFHVFQFGTILRYIDLLRYGVKSRLSKDKNSRDRRHYVEILLNEDSDATLLRLLECFLEAAPQLTLQLYILCTYSSDDMFVIRLGQGISCITSLASLSWALTSYHRSLRLSLPDKAKLSYKGMVLQFIWRLLTVGSRVLAFALFASQVTFWVFIVAGCHWVAMFIWVLTQKTSFCDVRMKNARCQEVFFDMIVAVIYIYCYLNIKEGHTRFRYLLYYTIVYAENLFMVLFWYMFAHTENMWYIEPSMAFIIGGFIVGILFQILYYLCFHPNNYPPYNKENRIRFYVSCGEIKRRKIERKKKRNIPPVEIKLLDHEGQQSTGNVASQFV